MDKVTLQIRKSKGALRVQLVCLHLSPPASTQQPTSADHRGQHTIRMRRIRPNRHSTYDELCYGSRGLLFDFQFKLFAQPRHPCLQC